MTEEEIYKKAKRRVEEKKGFYTHFGIYIAGIIFFFAINFLTNDHPHDDWWAFFPTLGWGKLLRRKISRFNEYLKSFFQTDFQTI